MVLTRFSNLERFQVATETLAIWRSGKAPPDTAKHVGLGEVWRENIRMPEIVINTRNQAVTDFL
jgi:hypothetical protein